jgi:hypothetical protein
LVTWVPEAEVKLRRSLGTEVKLRRSLGTEVKLR